jgi:predicted amidohydrolase
MLRVAGVQCDVDIGNKPGNLRTMRGWCERAVEQGARWVVFPECALTGYCFESREEAFEHAEDSAAESCQQVQAWCKELGIYVVYGYLEKDQGRLFNATNLVGPQGRIGGYRKTHLPFLGVDRFTDPGTLGYEVFQAGELRIGMLICYDCSFPEPNRCLALAGADVIVLPTNWPPGSGCTAYFVPNTRALENNVYYMAINRVGTERGFDFIGHSKICDPSGSTLVEAAQEPKVEMLVTEVDPERARRKHLVRVPQQHEIDRFKDRRPDLYGPLVD